MPQAKRKSFPKKEPSSNEEGDTTSVSRKKTLFSESIRIHPEDSSTGLGGEKAKIDKHLKKTFKSQRGDDIAAAGLTSH